MQIIILGVRYAVKYVWLLVEFGVWVCTHRNVHCSFVSSHVDNPEGLIKQIRDAGMKVSII